MSKPQNKEDNIEKNRFIGARYMAQHPDYLEPGALTQICKKFSLDEEDVGRIGVSICDIGAGMAAHSTIVESLLLKERYGEIKDHSGFYLFLIQFPHIVFVK